jgi:Gpi18-like mannosyltransferase
VAAFLMNIFAALFLYDVWKYKKILFYLLFIPIFFLTFPSNLVNAKYLSNDARHVIPDYEMEALNFLKKQPDGPVLAPIIDPDMAYVAAISGKPTYYNFENVLDNNGIDYSKRKKEMKNIEKLNIDSLDVTYIYITDHYPKHKILLKRTQISKKYKEIFNNRKVIIYSKYTSKN